MYAYRVRLVRSMVLPEHGRLVTYDIPTERCLTKGDIKKLQRTIRNILSIEYVPFSERVGK